MISVTNIAIDIETSGLRQEADRILEIGAVATDDNGTLLDIFHSYVRPNNIDEIDFTAEAFVGNGKGYDGNGITEDMLHVAPCDLAVFEQFKAWIESFTPEKGDGTVEYVTRCIGQNTKFDFAFLEIEFRRFGLSTAVFRRVIELSTMGYGLLPDHTTKSLQKLGEATGYTNRRPHRAITDAIQTSNVFHALRRRALELEAAFSKPQATAAQPRWPDVPRSVTY